MEKNITMTVSTGFTHGGKFHADDVFATALLRVLNPAFTWTRGFRVPPDFTGIVYDIGGGEFDHHTEPREARPDGVLYAAFGKLWRQFGAEIVPADKVEEFDKAFVEPIDNTDNTGEPNTLSSAISAFNPVWDASSNGDAEFAEAVGFAEVILRKEFARMAAAERATAALAEGTHMGDGAILVMERYAPTAELAEGPVALTVMPSQRGGWNLMTVKAADGSNKVTLPAAWRGKQGDPAAEACTGMSFCHAGGFIAAFSSKEDAIAAAKVSLAAK